jgi:hypothetical protein
MLWVWLFYYLAVIVCEGVGEFWGNFVLGLEIILLRMVRIHKMAILWCASVQRSKIVILSYFKEKLLLMIRENFEKDLKMRANFCTKNILS